MHTLLHNGAGGQSGSRACDGEGDGWMGDEGGSGKVKVEGVSGTAVCLLPMGLICNSSPLS